MVVSKIAMKFYCSGLLVLLCAISCSVTFAGLEDKSAGTSKYKIAVVSTMKKFFKDVPFDGSLVKKAEIIGQASNEFVNTNTGIAEYKTFTLEAIQQVQTEVIQKDDFLKLKANQVKNAQTQEELQIIEQELSGF